MEAGTELLLFLASVFFISLSGVMMPGPVFAVAVAKGHQDKVAGAWIAFGHGIVEIPLMSLIYIGFASVFASSAVQTLIGLVGGLVLILMGVQMFRARRNAASGERDLPYGSLAAGVVTTGANPYFFLWWATVGAALVVAASRFGLVGFVLLAAVHWLCDFFWNLFVSLATFRSRHLWSARTHEVVFGVCSAILVVCGVWFVASVV